MASIFGYPRFRHILPDGSPAVGYKVASFLAGTSTPTPTYTSQDQSATNTNPVILDGNGEAAIWLAPNISYKLVLRTDADVDIWTLDQIQTPEGGFFTTLSVTGAATLGSLTVTGATVLAAVSASGQITSTVIAGTAPFVITSATKVTNLNADLLDGSDWTTLPTLLKAVETLDITLSAGDSGAGPASGHTIEIKSTAPVSAGSAGDVRINPASGITGITNGAENFQPSSSFGGAWKRGWSIEEITLSTSGTTTDSTLDLLPANSIIEAVVARVTVTIATATDWKLGDSAQAARFLAAQSGAQLTAGATAVGLAHADPTVVSSNLGPVQTTAAKLRVTTTGTPTAGKLRIICFYRQFIAPTS